MASGRYSGRLQFERYDGEDIAELIRHVNEEIIEKLNVQQIELRRAIRPSTSPAGLSTVLVENQTPPPGGTVGGGGSEFISPLTVKGDIYVRSSHDTRLPVGTDGQIITADSTEATGLKWVNSSVLLSIRTGAEAVTTGANPNTITFDGGALPYDNWVILSMWMKDSGGNTIDLRDQVSNPTITGFDITVPEDGTLYYCVAAQTTALTSNGLNSFFTFSIPGGSSTVPFPNTLNASNWVSVSIWLDDGAGTVIDLKDQVSSPTINGFTINAPQAGTLTVGVSLPQ